MFTIDMMIGGIAGVISRTLTAPLELNKIQQQNYFMKNKLKELTENIGEF